MSTSKSHIASLILRLGFGLQMLLGHGMSKFNTLISGDEIHFPSILSLSPKMGLILAVLGEFVACIFIIVGYKTRYAAVFAIITMAMAAFVFHMDDQWFAKGSGGKAKEMAVLYLLGFIGIYLLGSGKYSLDNKFDHAI